MTEPLPLIVPFTERDITIYDGREYDMGEHRWGALFNDVFDISLNEKLKNGPWWSGRYISLDTWGFGDTAHKALEELVWWAEYVNRNREIPIRLMYVGAGIEDSTDGCR